MGLKLFGRSTVAFFVLLPVCQGEIISQWTFDPAADLDRTVDLTGIGGTSYDSDDALGILADSASGSSGFSRSNTLGDFASDGSSPLNLMSVSSSASAAVPEPSSLILLAAGTLTAIGARFRRRTLRNRLAGS